MGGKSGGGEQTIGYRYYFGIHMGAGRGPVDELVEIRVGDKSAWPFPEAPDQGFDGVTQITVPSSTPMTVPYNPFGFGAAELVIYTRTPTSWTVGMWVKFEHFVRDLSGTPITIDGVYQILGGNTGDQLTVGIPFGNDELSYRVAQYVNAAALVDGAVDLVITRVADASGTPLPDTSMNEANITPVMGSTTIQIEAPDLFGGDKAEGGIQGPMIVMMGEPDQLAPAELVSMGGSAQPGFRGMFTMFFDGLISSMNPYPKAWKFRIRRTNKGWDGPVFLPDYARITMSRPLADGELTSQADIAAMNPAHIIFECLTNRAWGRGLPREALNSASFEKCAVTLFNEGFGLCLRWTRTDTIQSFIQGVLDHITATLYNDPETALLTLKLIRDDYVIEGLPLFEPGAGLLGISDAPIASGGTYANELRVTYHDPITNEDRQARVQNLGSIQASGGSLISVSKSYPGIPTPALAARVAQRDLRVLGLELRKFSFTVDRRGFALRPGDVVRLRDPSRNIPETVVRIATFGDGTLQDGKISITGVQDVFGMPTTSYVTQQPNGWQPPASKPCIGRHEVFELPYALIARFTSPADLDYIGADAGYLGTVLEEGQPLNAGYRLAVRDGAPTPDDVPTGSGYYCGYVPPTP